MKRSGSFFGFAVIVIGLVLLLRNLDLVQLSWGQIWPIFPLLLGIFFYAKFVQSKDKGILIPATLFTGVGLFFFILTVPGRMDAIGTWWPVLPMILGLGFLLTFLADIRDTGLLIPAAIFLVIGGVFLADNIELTRRYLKYWPVLIVAVGLFMFVGNLLPESKKAKEPEVVDPGEPDTTEPPTE